MESWAGLGPVYSVAGGRLVLCPIAKSASTVLKRVAVIADGREPPAQVIANEVAPALAVHLPAYHGLSEMDSFQLQQEAVAQAPQRGLHLAVTRHPVERLVAFWYAKLFLQDPVYQTLNQAVGLSYSLGSNGSCDFNDFIHYLSDQWVALRSDVHLCPQVEWLGSLSFWTGRIDRNKLARELPGLFQSADLHPSVLAAVQREIKIYTELYHQKLGQDFIVDVSQASLAIIQKLYQQDFELLSYRVGDIRKQLNSGSPLARVVQSRRSQQMIVRNRQIAGLQGFFIASSTSDQQRETTRSSNQQHFSEQHNSDQAGLKAAYSELLSGQHEQALVVAQQRQSETSDDLIQGECLYVVGLAWSGLNELDKAVTAFQAAMQCGFSTPYVIFNLANCYRTLKQFEMAHQCYAQALELFPDFVECQHNLALLYKDQGLEQQALQQLRRLLLLMPDYYQASFTIAEVHRERYRFAEAIAAYRMSLEAKPDFCDAWNNLGLTQSALEQYESAIHSYQQALTIESTFKQARQNLAQLLVNRRRHQEALAEYQLFDQLNLNDYERVLSYQGKVNCLLELDRENDALQLASQWTDARVQLFAKLYVVPVLYRDEHHIQCVRERWQEAAQQLRTALDGLKCDDPDYNLLYAHVWSLSNFYLAYQLKNDRPLQELYAQILSVILRPRLGAFMDSLQPQPLVNRPKRVGVISPHLNNHNGSIWILGWLASMVDDPNYELYTYNITDKFDSGTRRFMAISKYRNILLAPDSIEQSLQVVRDDALDVLFFTDIGMHPSSKIISVMRLAPVQIQGWGHPVTSGSPSMDFYFSGEGMETDQSADHYSESLYLLPHIGLNYERPVYSGDASLLFDKYDLPLSRPILSSMQSTFKYHPSYDWVFSEIAARCPDCLITMVTHMGSDSVSKRLLQRMTPHFERRGLTISDHIRILPRLSYDDYLGFFQVSNHVLDTIGWNGGNSSLQALSLGCPVITLPTEFMRGRHTVAMLKRIGLQELIASSPEKYVELSVRLATDPAFRRQMADQIKLNANALFMDYEVSVAVRRGIDSFVEMSAY